MKKINKRHSTQHQFCQQDKGAQYQNLISLLGFEVVAPMQHIIFNIVFLLSLDTFCPNELRA